MSLLVQWLRPHASTTGDTGLIPGWGTKIPKAVQASQKFFKKEIAYDLTSSVHNMKSSLGCQNL